MIRYPGRVLERTAGAVVLEAFFSRERMELGYITLKPGDRFVEYFYADRWYNVFVIYDVDDKKLKGWYCNITRPARLEDGRVSAVDLALDLWIAPDGSALVLDEDEFAALPLAAEEQAAARAALDELRSLAAARAGPFAAK
jgi:predicted RNA-binding protein associated with RNAse of E/G family